MIPTPDTIWLFICAWFILFTGACLLPDLETRSHFREGVVAGACLASTIYIIAYIVSL